MCRLRVEAANPLFSYEERSDVPRLQQVDQKAVGRQRILGLITFERVTETFFSTYIKQKIHKIVVIILEYKNKKEEIVNLIEQFDL